MTEKLLVLITICSITLLTDLRKLMGMTSRSKLVYAGIMLLVLYASVDYLVVKELPDLHTLVDLVLIEPARAIVQALKG